MTKSIQTRKERTSDKQNNQHRRETNDKKVDWIVCFTNKLCACASSEPIDMGFN